MARTRQSTAKSTAPPVLDKSDYAETESDLTEVSDDESEYGSGKKKNKKGPSAKRARTTSTVSKSRTKKGSRQKISLSLLPTMPLDVLFEIFSSLPPKDIINLSRTSKLLRDILMTRGATTVWKAARERVGAPDCPAYMSEPQWAVLLFGIACQCCGVKNIQKVNFCLMRRLCTHCKKAHLVVESRFKKRFPDVDHGVLELLPYTNVGGWAHGYASNSRFFWDSDIDKMVHKLALYEHNVHLRLANARKVLDDFKAQQSEVIKNSQANSRPWHDWLNKFNYQRHNNKDTIIQQRLEAIKEKFIELGYVRDDLSCLRFKHECHHPSLLTDRIWQRIRPILEPGVLERKIKRIEEQMETLREARRKIVHLSYIAYIRTLLPSQLKYLPRTLEICFFEPFARHIDADAQVSVTAADFEEGIQQLPELLSAAADARKAELRSLIKSASTAVPGPSQVDLEPGELAAEPSHSSSVVPDPLELATSVFECKETHGTYLQTLTLVGWDDIASHHCRREAEGLDGHIIVVKSEKEASFSTAGADAARAIVRAAGLDVQTALASDMDAKDLRFTCTQCGPRQPRQVQEWVRNGYTWRTAIDHFVHSLHNPTLVGILSAEETATVKQCEGNDPKWQQKLWTCAHCSTYIDALQPRDVVLQHVKTSHNITSPQQPADMFLFERYCTPFRPAIAYSIPGPASGAQEHRPPKTVRCLHCITGRPSEKSRLFDVGGVTNHLAAKHKIRSPQKGIDWADGQSTT